MCRMNVFFLSSRVERQRRSFSCWRCFCVSLGNALRKHLQTMTFFPFLLLLPRKKRRRRETCRCFFSHHFTLAAADALSPHALSLDFLVSKPLPKWSVSLIHGSRSGALYSWRFSTCFSRRKGVSSSFSCGEERSKERRVVQMARERWKKRRRKQEDSQKYKKKEVCTLTKGKVFLRNIREIFLLRSNGNALRSV